MRIREPLGAASAALLVTLGSAGCVATVPTASAETPTREEIVADQVTEAAATVVVEGTYEGSITFCRRSGELTVRMLWRGDRVRGQFSGAVQGESSEDACGGDHVDGYWDIDASDPNDLDVLACEVNGIVAGRSIVFQREAGIEVECTREGAKPGMLMETTFYVDA